MISIIAKYLEIPRSVSSRPSSPDVAAFRTAIAVASVLPELQPSRLVQEEIEYTKGKATVSIVGVDVLLNEPSRNRVTPIKQVEPCYLKIIGARLPLAEDYKMAFHKADISLCSLTMRRFRGMLRYRIFSPVT